MVGAALHTGMGRDRSHQPGCFNILEQVKERMDNEDVQADELRYLGVKVQLRDSPR